MTAQMTARPAAPETISKSLAVPEADAATVRRWLDAGEILLVDVRETAEHEQEHIPGAVLCPCSAMLAFCERREGNNKQRKREKKERMNMNFFVLDVSRWIHGSTAAPAWMPGCLALNTLD